MGGPRAQEFEPMRREVDDEPPSAWLQEKPCGFLIAAAGLVEVMQNLMDADEVGRAVLRAAESRDRLGGPLHSERPRFRDSHART